MMPNADLTNFDIQELRSELLARVIQIFMTLGLALAFWGIGWEIYQGNTLTAGFHTAITSVAIIAALTTKISTFIRTCFLLAVLLTLAFWEFFTYGPAGEAPIFLVTALALITLMMGKRAGYVSIVASVAILVGIASIRIWAEPSFVYYPSGPNEGYRHWIATFLEVTLFCTALNYMIATLFERIIGVLETKEDSERRYKLLAENAEDVIWSVDLDFRCTYVSPSVRQLRGFEPSDLLGQSFLSLQVPKVVGLFQAAATALLDGNPLEHMEVDVFHRDGRLIPTETVMSLIADEDNKPTGLLGVTRDISVRKTMEAERSSLENQLRQSQKMDSLGQLAGGIAHDLNNLLQVIIGYSELAQAKLDENSPAFENIAEARDAADRATSLVRQLLAFSRQQVLEVVSLDLNVVITDLARILQRLIGEDIVLVVTQDPSLPAVEADRRQIEQVFVNLCVNARDAMSGTGTLEIRSTKTIVDIPTAARLDINPGDYAVLTVLDTGAGIEPDTMIQVFDPFFTTKKAGKGTGLGLSTAFGIIRQHGGTITVRSEVGQGAQFQVYLPVTNHPILMTSAVIPLTSDGGFETVLLADDEAMVLRVTADTLRDVGYAVVVANDGAEAVELFLARPNVFDLIILDVVMPNLGGKEASERIRKIRPNIPILFCSGYDSESVQINPSRSGVRLLSKPYLREDLLGNVRELLDQVAES